MSRALSLALVLALVEHARTGTIEPRIAWLFALRGAGARA
jgi:hypothetical protein